MKKWYSLDKIMRYDVPYRMIIGERGNGKSYSVKDRIIDKYMECGDEFLYVRRCKHQKTRANMVKVFDDMYDSFIDKYGKWITYSTDKGFYFTNGKTEDVPFGYAISVEEADKIKSIPLNRVTTIFFDEFLEYGNAIQNEIQLFLSIVSTVVRSRENVEIFMCGNTVTKFSPYFDLFGIDLKRLNQGQVYYCKHSRGASCALEWCSSTNIVNGARITNKYIGFDNNPTSDMILYGEWEYDAVNTTDVDGIGWSAKRKLISAYITALNEVYELSLVYTKNPIAFVRKINTQNGLVRRDIKYNISYDNSLKLVNKNGIVPMYGKVSKLMDEATYKDLGIFIECFHSKRIVYNNIESGSDFTKIFKYIQ